MTTRSRLSNPRWYEDACGTAHALELVGERWALLVMRELMFGPRRFGEIRERLPGISANVLTQRLEGLEAARIIVRRTLPSPANAQVYELTPWGYESEPIFQTMGRWAARSPSHDPSLPLSAASMLLSLRTMLDAKRAKGLTADVGLCLDGEDYMARLRPGDLAIRREAIDAVDVIFTGAPVALASVIYGGRPLADAEAAAAVVVAGDRALAKRFVTLFPLPQKVA